MSIALLCADLMQSSQVSGAAQRVGTPLRVFSSADALLAGLAAEPARLVIVDLALPGLDPARLCSALQELPAGMPRTLAFGAHVHRERLEQAREAGCDLVVSRGEFHARMDALLRADA